MAPYPGFIGGSYQAQSVIADSERTVNFYVEEMQSPGASTRRALYSTPGFTRWSLPTAVVIDAGSRALAMANGRLFAVIGSGFYEFDVNGTPTRWGNVAQDANPAQIVFNGVVGGHVGIASGGNAYAFVLATNTLSQVLSGGDATMLAYSDGYGLAFSSSTGKVKISNLNDLTTWNAGTFFQRSKFPDPWQAMFVDANGLIWLPGTDTFEVWYDTGSGTQPFAPLSGLVGKSGIVAPFAFWSGGPNPYWLSRNPEGAGQLIAAHGSGVQPVSTYAINSAFAAYLRANQMGNVEMLAYQQEGHTFVCLAFPSVPSSWAYDVEGKSWAERGQWMPKTGTYAMWAPRVHTFAFGKHLVGDRVSGTIWSMDTTVATETDGTGIRRLRRAPGLVHELVRQPYDRLELLMDVGLGVATGAGSNPQVMLRVSSDGGRTFGNERIAGFGRVGEYRRRVYWTQLGINQDAVFEVAVSDPIPTRIIDAFINNEAS